MFLGLQAQPAPALQQLRGMDYCIDLKMTQQEQLASWLKQQRGQ